MLPKDSCLLNKLIRRRAVPVAKILEQRSLAFRPFFTTRQGGLVQVKRMMERCGGVFSGESREGDGTVCPPVVQTNSLNMGKNFTQ